MSGLSTLFVSPSYHVWDCYWKSVRCSANAECPRSRMDHNNKVTLYLLLETDIDRLSGKASQHVDQEDNDDIEITFSLHLKSVPKRE